MSNVELRTATTETIVACSSAAPNLTFEKTAPLRDIGRAVVRFSGPQAFSIAATLFTAAEGRPALSTPGKKWLRIDGSVKWRNRCLSACAYRMPSPHSYTREDIVELHAPAIPWLVIDLLERAIAAGARAAQPGEFTRRAFENGRIGLEEAENIGALIRARTAEEARVLAARLSGHAFSKLARLRAGIEDLLSMVELGLDFSHEDVGVISAEEMLKRLQTLRDQAAELTDVAGHSALASAELHAHLPRVALIGPVNAGKSSLFNALLGRAAAIVNAAAHTTRDVIEAPLELPGGSCVLCDTAGVAPVAPASGRRNVEEPGGAELQKAAQQMTSVSAVGANILLVVLDGTKEPDDAEVNTLRLMIDANPSAVVGWVWSKADLLSTYNDDSLHSSGLTSALALKGRGGSAPPSLTGKGVGWLGMRVSAVSGEGLDSVREFLNTALLRIAAEHARSSAAAEASGAAAARSALAALERAHAGLAAGDGEDIVAVELREALHAFWQAEGKLMRHDAVTEAMLDRIFAAFCIGK